MKQIGQNGSPFVRRVGIGLHWYGLAFEHVRWSASRDADVIARDNHLRRISTLRPAEAWGLPSHRLWRVALCLLAVLAIGTTTQPSRASRSIGGDVGGAMILCVVAMGAAVADTAFTISDVAYTAQRRQPPTAVSVLETALILPQAILFDAMVAYNAGSSEKGGADSVLLLTAGAWTTSLSTHGIVASAAPSWTPTATLGTSAVLGSNLAMTADVLARALDGRFSPRSIAVTQLVFTAPEILGSALQIPNTLSERPLWIGLTVWSSTLFLHGIISLAVGGEKISKEGPASKNASLTPLVFGEGRGRVMGLSWAGTW